MRKIYKDIIEKRGELKQILRQGYIQNKTWRTLNKSFAYDMNFLLFFFKIRINTKKNIHIYIYIYIYILYAFFWEITLFLYSDPPPPYYLITDPPNGSCYIEPKVLPYHFLS